MSVEGTCPTLGTFLPSAFSTFPSQERKAFIEVACPPVAKSMGGVRPSASWEFGGEPRVVHTADSVVCPLPPSSRLTAGKGYSQGQSGRAACLKQSSGIGGLCLRLFSDGGRDSD